LFYLIYNQKHCSFFRCT